MKYGLIIDFGQTFCNYGDLVQSIAIEQVYARMGIPSEEIVHLTKKDLLFYDGEPILLPFSYTIFYLIDFRTKEPVLSNKIIPVFLGVSIESVFVYNCIPMDVFAANNSKWLELFRRNAPIGCRDIYTLQFMNENDIAAYLQGCITNIFPSRASSGYKKTLLVDCPENALLYIPDSLLEDAEVLSNVVSTVDCSIEENYRRVKARYDYYRDNAAIVVTSRYHVALPCNAMGIRSILIKPPVSKFSQDIRFDAVPPQIQICSTESDYGNINWYAGHEDFPMFKETILDMAATRIKESFIRHSKQNEIRRFFTSNYNSYHMSKDRHVSYADKLTEYILRCHAQTMGKFYIWGALDVLCHENMVELADIAMQINPSLVFSGFIDTYRMDDTLAGKPIIRPDDMLLGENDFVIVAADNAVQFAASHFEKLGLTERNFVVISAQILNKVI